MSKAKISYHEAFLSYLTDLIAKKDEHLQIDLKGIYEIFLKVLEDYFSDKISLNTLSSITTMLYFEFKNPMDYEVNPFGKKLGDMLEEASELEWHKENNKMDEFRYSLKNLEEYLSENKR